jgi:hypothetical protein
MRFAIEAAWDWGEKPQPSYSEPRQLSGRDARSRLLLCAFSAPRWPCSPVLDRGIEDRTVEDNYSLGGEENNRRRGPKTTEPVVYFPSAKCVAESHYVGPAWAVSSTSDPLAVLMCVAFPTTLR